MFTQDRILKQLISRSGEVDWERVYAEQLPRVYNYLRYRLCDEDLAEELTASAFEKAWRNRSRYRRDLGSVSSWLITIARNLSIDYYRQRRQDAPLETVACPETAPSAEEIVQHKQELGRLAALLSSLPDRERDLVALKYGAGMSNRDIARQAGLSESNVGTILNRVLHKLRSEWERYP